ncbi:hypothetical protein EV694_0477 [Volucribacter psittacicida]|uniref:Uncharacterized protein n=1 Tax=Volucribacter psittacicida TaxID=203482 RepID=A0A4R1G5K4_9PAST|nr:hypothetical protein EV694_0477 [Volucribacter psittacicida]
MTKKLTAAEMKKQAAQNFKKAYQQAKKNGTLKPLVM